MTDNIMQQHPITPPPKLVEQWADMLASRSDEAVFSLAAQWGADQELEACYALMDYWGLDGEDLMLCRRPKPPSLKEQALALLDKAEDPSWDINDFSVVRRALEQLEDN
jgi:hypothetical protein